MFNLLYTILLALFCLGSLPKLLLRRGKIKERLGFNLPPREEGKPLLWLHAVSVGEVRAASSLIRYIQKEEGGFQIALSTTTEAGLAEARRLFPELRCLFLLPVDFSWIIAKFMRHLKPELLLLVESDFWYNLIRLAPKVAIVSGKISERSTLRFQKFKGFTRRLFAPVLKICVQNEGYAARFRSLAIDPSKIVVSGNLKFDVIPPKVDRGALRRELGLKEDERVVTLGSTHAPEEEELLRALSGIEARILVVPRHLHRCEGLRPSVARYPKAMMIEKMGVLNACYAISDVAIVCGSFSSRVGGHNILEPLAFGVPVLFGPHMETQEELVQLVLGGGAGRQVEVGEVKEAVERWLGVRGRSPEGEVVGERGLKVYAEVRGTAERTWGEIQGVIQYA